MVQGVIDLATKVETEGQLGIEVATWEMSFAHSENAELSSLATAGKG
jgi:hypothetical protein